MIDRICRFCQTKFQVGAVTSRNPALFCSRECKSKYSCTNEAITERFWRNVYKTDSCWLWKLGRTPEGYGKFVVNHRIIGAHRYSYELVYGPINSSDLFVCHRCDVRECVRPEHLFLGTQQDNIDDMWAKARGSVGEDSGTNTLTEEQVRELRTFASTGKYTQYELGDMFGTSQPNVSIILNNITWKHI